MFMDCFRRRQDGSALILSILILGIMFWAVISLAFFARQMLNVSNRQERSFESDLVFLAGVNHVREIFKADETPETDSIDDPWMGEVEIPRSWQEALIVTAADEESKLNLNWSSQPALTYMIKYLSKAHGLEYSAEDLAEAIIAYRTKKLFDIVEEILLIKGIRRQDIEIFKEYFTAAPIYQVNINTAKEPVLKALIDTTAASSYIKESLLRALFACRNSGRRISKNELTAQALVSLWHLENTPGMLMALNQLIAYTTTDSQVLSLEMIYRKTYKASVIFQPLAADNRKDIIFWHETRIAA